jgi:RHS repeat-associated protein
LSTTVNGTLTKFVYAGPTVVQERLGSGAVKATLFPGLGIDEVFGRTEGTVNNWFLPDGLGSTLGITDASGVLQTQYTYDPFGSTTVTGAASTNSFQFTGRENDGTGLYYYRNRYYHPGLHRFISQDPSGFRGGDPNLYAYVGNNSINLKDPLGFDALQLGFNISYHFGSYSGNLAAGVAVDDHGSAAIYVAPGAGEQGEGIGGSIGIQAAYSNASTVEDLKGPFINYSATGGDVINGSVDAFAGPSDNGFVYGGGITAGLGFGEGSSVGETFTTLIPLNYSPEETEGSTNVGLPSDSCNR